MMFRSYKNTSEHFLRDYVAIAMAILKLVIFMCEDIVIYTCEDIMFMRESSPGI